MEEELSERDKRFLEIAKSWDYTPVKTFTICKTQIDKLTAWREGLLPKQIEISKAQFPDYPDDWHPYSGAIGGSLQYSFTHTSLGTVVKVTDSFTGEAIDLSDYEMW